jgi:hypothetical protein
LGRGTVYRIAISSRRKKSSPGAAGIERTAAPAMMNPKLWIG